MKKCSVGLLVVLFVAIGSIVPVKAQEKSTGKAVNVSEATETDQVNIDNLTEPLIIQDNTTTTNTATQEYFAENVNTDELDTDLIHGAVKIGRMIFDNIGAVVVFVIILVSRFRKVGKTIQQQPTQLHPISAKTKTENESNYPKPFVD